MTKRDWKPGDMAWVWDKFTHNLIRVTIRDTTYGYAYKVAQNGHDYLQVYKVTALFRSPDEAVRYEIKRLRDTINRRENKIRGLMNEKHDMIYRRSVLQKRLDDGEYNGV